MDLDTFLKEHEDLIAKSVDLLKAKNKDYSTDGDPLAGFKKIANDIGISPFQVWAIFASKHWNALTNFAKDGKVESEPIEGRIIDMINYSVLLHLLIIDNRLGYKWGEQQSQEFIDNIKHPTNIISKDDSIFKPLIDSNPNAFNTNAFNTNKEFKDIRLKLNEYERNALDRVKGMTHLTPEVLKIYFNI